MTSSHRHLVPGCQNLFDLITQGILVHDGAPTLREHALNGASKTTSRGGWMFAKPVGKGGRTDESRKIDAIVALMMACEIYAEDNDPGSECWTMLW